MVNTGWVAMGVGTFSAVVNIIQQTSFSFGLVLFGGQVVGKRRGLLAGVLGKGSWLFV